MDCAEKKVEVDTYALKLDLGDCGANREVNSG